MNQRNGRKSNNRQRNYISILVLVLFEQPNSISFIKIGSCIDCDLMRFVWRFMSESSYAKWEIVYLTNMIWLKGQFILDFISGVYDAYYPHWTKISLGTYLKNVRRSSRKIHTAPWRLTKWRQFEDFETILLIIINADSKKISNYSRDHGELNRLSGSH